MEYLEFLEKARIAFEFVSEILDCPILQKEPQLKQNYERVCDLLFDIYQTAGKLAIENTNFDDNCIKVWRYENAPTMYKELVKDDVSWIAFIPNEVLEKESGYIPLLEKRTGFGCCEVKKFKTKYGEIWVGCHV